MKKIVSLSLFLLVTVNAVAQFNIQAGYTYYPLKAPGFNTFFDTYNTYFSNLLQTPFKPSFPAATGWQWKVGFKLPKHDKKTGFYYNSATGVNHLVTHNSAVFKNGEERKLTLKCRDWTTDVALGAGGKVFYAAVTGSIVLRNNKLYCGYIYNDGTESFGTERNLNGIYGAFRIMGGYGFEVGAGTRLIKVVGKIHKIYKPLLKNGSTYLEYYKDLSQFKGGLNNPTAGSWPAEYFPADVSFFTQNQMDSEAQNNFVYINDYGWEYTIAIQLMLDFKD